MATDRFDLLQGQTLVPYQQVTAAPSSVTRKSSYYEVPKRLVWAQLTGSDATLYTAPAAPSSGPPGKVRIDTIWLSNTDTVARTVTLEIRTGASAASTQLLPALSVAANTTVVLTELNMIMEASEIISGLCSSASKVNLRISGAELLTLPTA
jgi:hypothetical protein